MKKYLLTGIPRSGTTLSCKILNSLNNVIALHEPLSPNKLTSIAPEHAIIEVKHQIDSIEGKLVRGEPFEHGSTASLILDNPIQEKHTGGLRRLRARRGLLALPPQIETANLIIKQNALFAALLPVAIQYYQVVSIIRNPVDVFLSWMNVDLPVNRGRIPGGERFNNELKQKLEATSHVSERQVIIYEWFITQYQNFASRVLKYEDIVDTQGAILANAFGFTEKPTVEIKNIKRSYDKKTIDQLESVISTNSESLSSEHYSINDISHRLEEVCASKQ